MELISVIEFILTLSFIGYLVHHYSMKNIHIGIKITVYISWLLSFGFIIILPLDVYFVKKINKFKFIIILKLK
jgi:hypothetical protein